MISERVLRLKSNYTAHGLRTCVEVVLLVELFKHPHVLLLQYRNSIFKLPGGRLRPGESDIEGLKCKLASKLWVNENVLVPGLEVGECIGMWLRPNFETLMYPFLPPNVKHPKVLSDSEPVRLLNHAVEKIWPICMEQIASQKILSPIIPWFLDKYRPWTAKEALIQHLYLGRNPPLLTDIRVLRPSTVQVSGYCGLLLGSPVIWYEIIAFVLPGLTRAERRFLGPIVFGSSLLFYVLKGSSFLFKYAMYGVYMGCKVKLLVT